MSNINWALKKYDSREALVRGICPNGHEVVVSDTVFMAEGSNLTCPHCEKERDSLSSTLKMCTEIEKLFRAVRQSSEEAAARQLEWDRYWLKKAKEFGLECSKDPSTKAGAVIVGPDNEIVSMGYNGFARKVKDLPERYENRDVKYKMVVHCEVNAILFADRWRLKGATLYTWPFMCCSNCAAVVIQAGITRCVAPPIPPDQASRWVESIQLARMQFEEAGVELVILPDEQEVKAA